MLLGAPTLWMSRKCFATKRKRNVRPMLPEKQAAQELSLADLMIGDVRIHGRVLIAPMTGISDLP
jgi:hypothetical protein